ncbi:p53 and DNA damage-regulated protein 1, partial [Caligus rogercresseyi]
MLERLLELEQSAEEIVDLDRKRQSNREALSGLRKVSKTHWAGENGDAWLALGNTFISLPMGRSIGLLEQGNRSVKAA